MSQHLALDRHAKPAQQDRSAGYHVGAELGVGADAAQSRTGMHCLHAVREHSLLFKAL